MKEVVKAIRKKNKGYVYDWDSHLRGNGRIPTHGADCGDRICRVVVLAGNISPIDVISHLPVLCEDADLPYIYVPSKEDLGAAAQTKRPTSCMLVLAEAAKKDNKMSSEDEKKFKEEYDTVLKKVKASEMVFSTPSSR